MGKAEKDAAGPGLLLRVTGDPAESLQPFPPTSCCGKSAPGGLRERQREFSNPRQRGNHRPSGPASPGTWAGKTKQITVIRGFSRALGLPQTYKFAKICAFFFFFSSHFTAGKRKAAAERCSVPPPGSSQRRPSRGKARNTQGAQIEDFWSSPPKIRAGGTKKGTLAEVLGPEKAAGGRRGTRERQNFGWRSRPPHHRAFFFFLSRAATPERP